MTPMAKPPKNQSADQPRGVRLQKFLAEVGVASRRVAEELIEEGRVKVGGKTVRDLPVFIDPASDVVQIDGRRIMNAPERHLYVMLHKPRRCVSTVLDPEGRRTVADLVKHPSKARLYPVGRLDFDTSGLLLMTNDGELTNRLTHPRYGVHKTYRATVKGQLEPEAVEELERGIYLAERKSGETVGGKKTMPVKMSIASRDRDRTVLELTLQEGRNRQVRRMLARVGCPVKKLVRTRMGPLKLKGLAVGEWRELTRTELGALRKEAGLTGSSKGSKPNASKPGRTSGAPR
jgi:pseudouridine synthase